MRSALLELAERVEKLEGPSDEADALIVQAAYDLRLPIPCYGGEPINYDPMLWMERYCFEPTGSIDAAASLVPSGMIWGVANVGVQERCATMGRGTANVGYEDETTKPVEASTPALALCAAALRAIASQEGK